MFPLLHPTDKLELVQAVPLTARVLAQDTNIYNIRIYPGDPEVVETIGVRCKEAKIRKTSWKSPHPWELCRSPEMFSIIRG